MNSNADVSRRRLAVVLFNLGGPEGPEDVEPFLRSLFGDPAILGVPKLVRRGLAWMIARARRRSAVANYAVMGGGSPLLANTLAQAEALRRELLLRGVAEQVRVEIAMRHWRPSTDEALAAVRAFAPDDLVLAPLYPQCSTTTTGSSLAAWRALGGGGEAICCWPDNAGLLTAHAEAIEATWTAAGRPKVRLLFSAHGLPERVVHRGDPYAWQVNRTCAGVVERLSGSWDWRLCYQSRVGPVAWLRPATPEAITQAVADGLGILISPISFVSEHVETLVELDRDYERLARRLGAACYLRAPALGESSTFVAGLADAVERCLSHGGGPDGLACPADFAGCARRLACSMNC